MTKGKSSTEVRCAIYTRKSTEEGLEQEFNSLDAQRESAEAYIKSQAHEGWVCLHDRYDDGGYTGGNMDRPAMRRLLGDIEAGKINCVVAYKVDRLSRSLLDFAKMMETFDKHRVSFVSVTQQFNTANSMGRLMQNVLLSFAQFEREIISERTRDKIAVARRKGKWSGGHPILGYDVPNPGSKLVVNEAEASQVRAIFDLYIEHEALLPVVQELGRRGWTNKLWTTRKGQRRGGHHRELQRLIAIGSAGPGAGERLARLADLQEQIRETEKRLSEVRLETERHGQSLIGEAEVSAVLAQFDLLWQTLSPREQARVLQLLIERVDYDGREDLVSVTFRPTGLKTLFAETRDAEQGDAA